MTLSTHQQPALETCSGWQLGAPLYVPALHPDLLKIANAEKIPFIRSMIICTEDAIFERDVNKSLEQLRQFLPFIQTMDSRYRFIRVRNPQVLRRILDLPGIENINGFVLPKFDNHNRESYLKELRNTRFLIMPTLESSDVFIPSAMRELALSLTEDPMRSRIILLRIGGNDLLNLIGLRRPRGVTLYETPIATVISQLVITFRPLGFSLSAPVFEYLADRDTLNREIDLDLAHGLVGKTAIHPSQIPLIENRYAVSGQDYREALSILDEQGPAVFKMHEAMCEISTHSNWARQILTRYDVYGQDDMIRGMNAVHSVSSTA
ncbi:HpcH/HpaI aldolase/citrate lyase family protein [Methylicorpusculum sp.]|uniref:HpcH/HpaI aldolase/citrate lyase family protein n=2 Tax=Methylicorpusculum sp. TaxID=2713644 RepID=UPI0027310B8B|nr:HpcH/HpaI aldolase/citrate lyase family protein [Methylicorpusculum sp.]MDP2177222.1 HpcH/HpaI aldolase/citrate lyase family protein [Methylicorpusculum sp.]MDP3531147.1 HpcH/HpaI aldolase/citrate lyase family protein [Methylicorpusculum sp.]